MSQSEVLGRQEVPGASISSGCDPGPQWSDTRFTCSWVMPRRPSGHLYRLIAAQRAEAAAVTRMYQRGRAGPSDSSSPEIVAFHVRITRQQAARSSPYAPRPAPRARRGIGVS